MGIKLRDMGKHVAIPFANPYVKCTECQGWVTEFHSDVSCGTAENPCGMGFRLFPCSHTAPLMTVCPSWSPLEDCDCQRFGILHEYPPHKRPEDAVFVMRNGAPVWVPDTDTLYVVFGLETNNDDARIHLMRADKYDRMRLGRLEVEIRDSDKS